MQFRIGLLTILTALLQSGTLNAAPVEESLAERSSYTSCTITSFNSLAAAKKSCSTITIGDLTVPAGQTLDLTGLPKGTKVLFTGRVTFGYKAWVGPLVSVSGTNITVSGTPDSLLDGCGPSYWDGLGGNGGKAKPKFFFAHKMIDSKISGLNILNTPVHCFSIGNSQNLLIDSVKIDNKAGYGPKGGHNTDAFDVGNSDRITINKAIVYNQDDCLAVNSGTNIKFTNGYCSGGHGVSIGSVGGRDNNIVSNVTVSNTTIVDSENGVRIKTVYGATGCVSNITYSDITLKNITRYGIVIRQDYQNGSPTGNPTAGVPIENLKLKNVKGTVNKNATQKFILCASCHNFTFTDVSITNGLCSTKCQGVPYPVTCSSQ